MYDRVHTVYISPIDLAALDAVVSDLCMQQFEPGDFRPVKNGAVEAFATRACLRGV